MYLVDTNILIWIIRGAEPYVRWFEDLKGGTLLSLSTITVAEIHTNIFPEELIKTEQFINQFDIWDVTTTIAKQGGLYWQQYSKQLKNLNILDCIIAATAKEHDLTLLTLNTRHFPMKNIRVMNPLKK